MGKRSSILIDIDGTLANCDHRLKHVEKVPKDWDSFFLHMDKDEPNSWCLSMVHVYVLSGFKILFVTGRNENHREETLVWFKKYMPLLKAGKDFELYMRKTEDYRQDTVMKAETYRQQIEGKYNVLFAVDDRASVVRMWRDLGLTCLQCAEGDF